MFFVHNIYNSRLSVLFCNSLLLILSANFSLDRGWGPVSEKNFNGNGRLVEYLFEPTDEYFITEMVLLWFIKNILQIVIFLNIIKC